MYMLEACEIFLLPNLFGHCAYFVAQNLKKLRSECHFMCIVQECANQFVFYVHLIPQPFQSPLLTLWQEAVKSTHGENQ
jgi:hypothetical protein